MFPFAAISFDPAAFASWVVAGLFSGWFAGKVMAEPSYGTMGDLLLGAGGGLIGGLAYGFFKDDAGFWGSVVIAVVGAWVFIVCGRTIVAKFSE